MPSPMLPGPVLTRFHVAPQSSERQISSFSPPVPSHTVRGSNGSTTTPAATVPFTAGFDDIPGGVTFSHMPGAGRLSHAPTGGSTFMPPAPALAAPPAPALAAPPLPAVAPGVPALVLPAVAALVV